MLTSGVILALSLTRGESKYVLSRSGTELVAEAPARAVGEIVTYSPKVFIPLTRLCRDRCSYCTFAHHDGVARPEDAFLSRDEVLGIARAGVAAGCTEALFTLGDRPERRWPEARAALASMGHASTVSYVAECAQLVLEETSLLPHANCGVLSADELALLRTCTASQGLMLECSSDRLLMPGSVHHRCPDKVVARRMATIVAAGELRVPFTSGLLVGIGESREERLAALQMLASAQRQHGHLMEVIVQPFWPKAGTPEAGRAPALLDEVLWTIRVARLVLEGLGTRVQSPPNLFDRDEALLLALAAGVEDWGGISPGVTVDHVNPERPWPEVSRLRRVTEGAGLRLVPRLPSYPSFVADHVVSCTGSAPFMWHHPAVAAKILAASDAEGYARGPEAWFAGDATRRVPEDGPDRDFLPGGRRFSCGRWWEEDPAVSAAVRQVLRAAARAPEKLDEAQLVVLLTARGPDLAAVCAAADLARRSQAGQGLSFVQTMNIN